MLFVKLIDANGKEFYEKGKVVMVDNLKTVTARIYEFRQFKSSQVTAKLITF
jgi:DNA/RNA-binding domain of Phe-tRNA-synthetase-like protein